MKKKEREHLKEDPFQHFMEQAWARLVQYRKMIFIGLGAVAAVAIIFLLVLLIRSGIASSENRIYSQAVNIMNNEALTVDQKIEKLSKVEFKGGISACVPVFLASLHFEKGDLPKAEQLLKSISGGSTLVQQQKQLLQADILNASDKSKEALAILNTLLTDAKTEVPRDFTLLKMAKIQARSGQIDAAVANLNRLSDEFPESPSSAEARNLLEKLEKK